MNLAFDSRPAGESSGIGRYTRCLLDALRSCADTEIVETHKPRASAASLYHSPWLDGALLHPPLPMVVTMHDTIPLRHRSEMLRSGMRLRFRYLALTRAERVITPTRAIADQVIANLDVAAERIEVIPEAVDPVFSARGRDEIDALLKRRKLPENYLLWVGDMSGAVHHRAVSQLTGARRELPLVLVGPGGRFLKSDERTFVVGEVSDDELAVLYSGAQALLFPTDDDGFGLPTVEALACGTPVFAYDTPAMREVVGDRAELFAVDEIEALVRAAESAGSSGAGSSSAGGAASAGSSADARSWTWEDVARATFDVYESVCRTPAASQQLMSGSSSRRRRRGADAEAAAGTGAGAAAPAEGRRTRTKV